MKLNLNQQAYWRKNLRAIVLLLTLWFLLSFVLIYFARQLSFSFFGWPFSFWAAGQGAPLVYCAIVAIYARYMSRLDRRHEIVEGQE